MRYKVGDKLRSKLGDDSVYVITRAENGGYGLEDAKPNEMNLTWVSERVVDSLLEKVGPERWRARHKGYYWFIKDDGEIACDVDDRLAKDSQRYQFGNYFETKKIAENIKHSFTATVNELRF